MTSIIIAFLVCIYVELFIIVLDAKDIKDELKEINKNMKEEKGKSLWFSFFINLL